MQESSPKETVVLFGVEPFPAVVKDPCMLPVARNPGRCHADFELDRCLVECGSVGNPDEVHPTIGEKEGRVSISKDLGKDIKETGQAVEAIAPDRTGHRT